MAVKVDKRSGNDSSRTRDLPVDLRKRCVHTGRRGMATLCRPSA